MHYIVEGVLASNVVADGTMTAAYPARQAPENANTSTDEGDFYLAMGHKLVFQNGGGELSFPADFDLTFGTSSITVTNKQGVTWPAGSKWKLQLGSRGDPVYGKQDPDGRAIQRMARMAKASTYRVSLGAPDALVTNGIAQAQNLAEAGDMTLNGSLVVGGVAYLDVPRNVIVDSGGADTAVLTVYGTDEYGQAMRESITLNGTTAVAGKKAFKTITRIAASAALANGVFVGTGDVLGLPFFLASAGDVIKELADGAAATAGTLVAGLRAADGSTATSADVRGTYDPNSACDGQIVFELIVSVTDPGFRGIAQYNG